MSTVDVLTMQETPHHASESARQRATMSHYINNDKGEGSSNSAYGYRNGTAVSSSRETQHPSAARSPSSVASDAAAGDGDQDPPRPSRRPSGIALPTHQALAHDPVYMAARTSPIGPPPRAALPALPPGPSGFSGPPDRNGLPSPLSQQQQQQQQQGTSSGMLAMASESRPLTAVYNGDRSLPSSSDAGQAASAMHSTSSTLPSTKDRTNRRSNSASRQRRQQASEGSLHGSGAATPSRHERYGTDASAGSAPPGPSSSPRAQQAEGSTDRMASKTVLTIALLEAQTAVDLDESDQAEAAIASYSKSVELLQEVMRRVSENAGTYRQKELDRIAEIRNERMARWKQWRLEQYRRAGLHVNPKEIQVIDEEIETREERREREKREARIAKRERMRVEECAKLRVIQDTYAERVRALKDEIATRGLQSQPQQPSEQAPRHSEEAGARQQLATLSIDGEGRFPDQPGIRSIALPSTSTSPPDRVLSSAVPFPASSPSSQSNARLSYMSSSSASPPSLALPEIHPFSFSPANPGSGTGLSQVSSQVSQGKQTSPSNQQSVLSFSPDSETSDNTMFSEQQQRPGSKSVRTHRKNVSSSASLKRASAEGYATFGDLAAQHLAKQSSPKPSSLAKHTSADDASSTTEGLATPTPDTAFSKAFTPYPDQEERNSVSSEANRSRAGSRASNALKHMTSNESLASTTTSSSLGRDQWNNASQKMPLPPMPTLPKGVSASPPPVPEAAGNRASIVGSARPLRSASLVAGKPSPMQASENFSHSNGARALASENHRASALLINPSTLHGTISQRRKSPQMPDSASFADSEEGRNNNLGVPQSSEYQGMTGLGLTRTSSTERAPGARASTVRAAGGNANASTPSNGSVSPQPFNVAGPLPMRLRALSQPSKRPAMSSSHSDFGSGTPPLPSQSTNAPSMQRADSDLSNTSASSNDPPPTPSMPITPMSFDYPGSLDEAGSVEGGNDSMVSPNGTHQVAMDAKSITPHATSFLEPETPASASFQQHHSQPSPGGPKGGAQVEYQPPPSDVMRIPFHFMRQIRISILSGAYLTPRLYIPKQLWSQSSIKLVHTETKVRMIDLILNGLESIERTAGDILLNDGKIKAGNIEVKIDSANKLMRELENFDSMLDGIQSTLAKKLPYIEQPNGKKGGGGSFGAWSSKLSRSMDRMTKGKNLDAPETYVAAIARLCLHAQILDRHLASLHGESSNSNTTNGQVNQDYRFGGNNNTSTVMTNLLPSNGSNNGYNDIPSDRRAYIEMRLKRTSDFFSRVICKMLLNDLGIWLDKYSKRAAGWTTD